MSTADFGFPLNVYACMLEAEEGRLDHLHHGLFEHESEPVWQAQARSDQRLLSVLPPPCRVLSVGIGVGTTLRRLADAGYQVSGVSPDAAQVAEIRARHGQAVHVVQASLDALPADPERWDLMLLQEEGAQSIAPLALLEAADRLLVAEQSHLVVMGEFALAQQQPVAAGRHDRAQLLALARRMGWEMVQDQDLSSQARGTWSAVKRLMQRQQDRLKQDLGLTAARLDKLVAAAERNRSRYDQGIYGYHLLHLHRPQRPALRLGSIGDKAAAVCALFPHAFGKPMEQAEWHWKYGDGRGRGVGLWQGEQLLAHCAATTRMVWMDGRLEQACQVGDVMVLPAANAGLGRQGALQQVSATLLETEIGWGRRHLMGFGFPNARAMKAATKLGLYAAVDEVVQLEWAAPPPVSWRDAGWCLGETNLAHLEPGSAVWRALDRLWAQQASALAATLLPQRDPAWLCHRYGQRPGVRYRLLLLRQRLTGRAFGALVLREHDADTELMDLIGPPKAFRALIRAARRLAAERGNGHLTTWITQSHAKLLDDPADPARRTSIEVMVPTSVHTTGPSPDSLRGRWFLMSGDTDFR